MISIIIPHFNRSEIIGTTIETVKAQTDDDWEIIIVDDISDAEEWQNLQKYASEKIKIFQRQGKFKGPSACRNEGAQIASGDYLIFLDSDDLLANFCLQQRGEVMQSNRDLDAAVFLMQEFEDEDLVNGKIFNRQIERSAWIGAFLRNENPWQTMCPIWKRESFLKIGGFDEHFLFMEDPELHLRALSKNLNFETFYKLPADCYYRVNHLDETKKDFYYNSIFYRIRFYRKLTSGFYPAEFLLDHKKEIKSGINNLIKTFLYSRKNDFIDLYANLMNWIKSCGFFSTLEIVRYSILLNLGNSNSRLLKRLKIKGICYQLLPKPH